MRDARELIMSMPEFLRRVRLAQSLLPPGFYMTLSGQVDERLRQKALNSADVWLDRSFIAGVDVSDFFYLDESDRNRLGRWIEEFAKVAEAVSPGQGPTAEQRGQGLDILIEFVKLLQPVPIPDKNLIETLWKLEDRYPAYVLGFDCEFGTDSTGDPAVWVWAVVPDDTDVRTPAFDRFQEEVTRAVRSWLKAMKPDRDYWPYVRLRTPSAIKDEIAEVVE